MKRRILHLLNLGRAWVNRVLWARSATHSYNKPPEPGSVVSRFQDNEEIPLKGVRWRVVKRVGGVEPVLMLQPIAPTAAAVKLRHGQLKKHHRRLLEAEQTKARASVRDHQLVDRLAGSKVSKAS